jgi:undecaprenyl-diphosphatase
MNRLTMGSKGAMSASARRTLAPLVVVTAAAFAFAVLLVLVRLQWAPLESLDHSVAARLNSLVAGHAAVVRIVKRVTWLGSGGVLWTLVGIAVVVLAIRRRWRLAIYLLVTGAGALTLDPVLKAMVGRLRPVVAHPIAYGNGDSFPSGHALGSIVCYGALFLVFLPATRGMWRRVFTAVIITLIAAIGISRLLLGVHFVSDVLGAWALGITWLGITAFAFELSRQATGAPVTDPVSEGLEPEARADLQPAERETTMHHDRARSYGRIAAEVVVIWVLIVGALTGIGKLIMNTHNANGNLLGDSTIPHWFAAHRTPTLNRWSLIASNLGATQDILIVSVVACVVFLAVTRRWRPVIFLAVVMFGELAAFLAIAAIVRRPRPDVPHLDTNLPTSAFPSGHMAATTCLYVGIAILVIGHARGWWRYLFLIPATVMPVMIAVARMYRGEHHPTDILGSLLFAALWLTATTMLVKPNEDAHRTGHMPRGLLRRKAADHRRETAPATPEEETVLFAAPGRDADRDRAGMDLDAQFPTGWARAAVELVADLLVEPDPELLPLRDLDEGGLIRMPEGEPAECPGPLDRVPGRHQPELEVPVIRLRLRERLDSAEYLANVRGQHARDLALEEALAVYIHGRVHPAHTEVPGPGDDVGGTAQPVLHAPISVGDHPRVEASASHHRETLAVHRAGVQPAPVPVQPDLHRLGKIARNPEVHREQIGGPRGQDRHRRVRSRHRVDAALNRAVAAPDEHHVSPLFRGLARIPGGAAALAHLVPQRVGNAFPGQDLPQLRQATAQALPRVRHHGYFSHARFPSRAGPSSRRAQTFRQRASQSPYTPKTTRPRAASIIRISPNG